MWSIENITCIVFLLLCAVMDIKWRGVPLIVLGVGAVGVAIVRIQHPGNWLLYAGGISIGFVFLLFSKGTREKFGYGDSLMILLLGAFLGMWKIIYLLVLAFCGSAIFSIILLIGKRGMIQKEFPFIPFMALGYLGVLCL